MAGSKNYSINDQDIERFIERQVVVTLRTMFTLDDRFEYNQTDKESDFSITADFPHKEIPDQETSITVTGINYTFNLQSTIGQNAAEDVYMKSEKTGKQVLVGTNYRCFIPFNLTILCDGEEYMAKDLANQVVNIFAITGKKIVEKLGLTIYNINKGSCQLKSQTPSKIFEVPVSLSGAITWCGIYRAENVDEIENILNGVLIKFNIEQGLIIDDRLDFLDGSGHEPGVYIKEKK